jgi:hypothetical protein
MYFRQDGAPPHFTSAVHNYTNKTFSGHIIDTRQSIEWLPRPPDLTVTDFFFWRLAKDKVFAHKPRATENLKSYNENTSTDTNNDSGLCIGVIPSILAGLRSCGHSETSKP